MVGSAVLYSGLVACLCGVALWIRARRRPEPATRRRAVRVLAAGLAVAVVAVLLPARERRVGTPRTQLDEFVPVWQFEERHRTVVRASPAKVESAMRAVTAREIRLFRLLTWIRRPQLPGSGAPQDILSPAADEPILDVALGSGFFLLAEQPARELVIGTLVIAPPETRLAAGVAEEDRAAWPPGRLRDLTDPGYAKAVMNFLITPNDDGSTLLETETRIFATDPWSRRRFAAYWRLIYPGSSLIRYMWLDAIRDRAEAGE